MSMLTDMLERDRKRYGFAVGQAACRLGLTVPQYRALLEGRHQMFADTWQRICDLYGWPQTFAATSTR
jgi:hypothetical protein